MPWLEDLKFPRGYQMGTHIIIFDIKYTFNFSLGTCSLYYWYQFGSKTIYKHIKSALYMALLFILSLLELAIFLHIGLKEHIK